MIEGHDYTICSRGPGSRARIYALLALLTAFITPLAQHGTLSFIRQVWGDDWDMAERVFFFGGFTALVLFGILVNLFTNYLWRTPIGWTLFRVAALPAPPDLADAYEGTIEIIQPTSGDAPLRVECQMWIAQTWEQMSMVVARESGDGSMVHSHSDMAMLEVGMLTDVVTLRTTYTFEETLPRRLGVGMMNRTFCGATILHFTREEGQWHVTGHFFDDEGRSGQLHLKQTGKQLAMRKLHLRLRSHSAAPSRPVDSKES